MIDVGIVTEQFRISGGRRGWFLILQGPLQFNPVDVLD
jgi:hypothetical protein